MAEEWPRQLPDHVTTPLLDRITRGSLDEDYQQVAVRRASSAPGAAGPGRPRLVATAVIAVFGVLVTTAALQTSANADINDASRETLISRINLERDQVEAQQQRIADLQDETIELEDQLDNATSEESSALARQRRLEVLTGYVPVTGEGVRITVDDVPNGDLSQLVRDEDLAWLVDGLWHAGAEAIAINDQRLTVLSAIRNRGPAVRVNSLPVNPPYVVEAIGDRSTLQANLIDTTHGARFFDLADDLGFPLNMQNEEDLTLPAARGPRLRHVERGTSGKPGLDTSMEANP